MRGRLSERSVLFLIGAVQFINILDFMMVMPLGPDFARALGIDASELGYIGGSYTASAAVSGLIGSYVLERFDRRQALLVAMGGLVLGTLAGGFATGFEMLLLTRVVAGFFGGPATSVSLSIIADLVPPERRGKALGAVMGAFSVASVLGVPAGLELSRLWGWRSPFFALGGLGLVVSAGVIFILPAMKGHLAAGPQKRTGLWELLSRREVQLSYLMTALVMMAGFILIPNLSAYLQYNLGYPRAHLGYLYMAGGLVSFGMMRIGGRMADRLGPFRTTLAAAPLLVLVSYFGFYVRPPVFPVMLLFVLFMAGMALRNVSHQTLASLVPRPNERATFMSVQSSIQHLASALAAFLSAVLLTQNADGTLAGMPSVALANMALTAVLPVVFFAVERRIRPSPPRPG